LSLRLKNRPTKSCLLHKLLLADCSIMTGPATEKSLSPNFVLVYNLTREVLLYVKRLHLFWSYATTLLF